jgi:hypothetical protein
MKVVVTLNGTDKNPWHTMNLTRNPFPQLAKAEFSQADDLLADLDGDPIVDADDLRKRLRGCSQEFIDVCVAQYQPGKRIRFVVEFPSPYS